MVLMHFGDERVKHMDRNFLRDFSYFFDLPKESSTEIAVDMVENGLA